MHLVIDMVLKSLGSRFNTPRDGQYRLSLAVSILNDSKNQAPSRRRYWTKPGRSMPAECYTTPMAA